MNTKKKLLIALLSATCLTAGAFGLAACGDSQSVDPDEGLKSAYATYQQAAGDDAMSYENWLAYIKSNNSGTSSDVNELEEAYNSYKTIAGGNALSYENWTALITSANLGQGDTGVTPPVEDVDKLQDAYAVYVEAAGDAALTYNEWYALITSEMKNPLETAYETYLGDVAENNGLALDYEDWLAMIQTYTEPTTNKVIVSSYVDNFGNFMLKFSDDTEVAIGKVSGDFTVECNGETITLTAPQLFTVRAVDQNGNAVKDAYLKICKVNGYNYTDINWGKTDKYGYLFFSFVPEAGATYCIKLANTDDLPIDPVSGRGTDPTPTGYELDLGTNQLGFPITDLKFDDSYELEFTFRNYINRFSANDAIVYKYSREYNEDDPENPIVTNEPLELNIKKGIYTYFTFSPYEKPETVTYAIEGKKGDINPATGKEYTAEEAAEENQRRLDNAEAAAVGTYEIKFSANSSNVSLIYFEGTYGYTNIDEDGIPTILISIAGKLPEGADESIYTGTNSIIRNLNSNSVRGADFFAIVAEDNCNVTVTIERIGDEIPVPEIEYRTVEVSGNPAAYPDNTSGDTLTLMPINPAWDVLYNENDGYYHVNGLNGPLLLVNINKAISRVNPEGYSLATLPQNNPFMEALYQFVAETDEYGNVTVRDDYNELIAAYSKLCNSDGVYPVNKDLYNFLENYGDNAATASSDAVLRKLNWLIPCQYYAPANGFTVDGKGTAADPFVLRECLNNLTVSSDSVINFTASSDGIYEFEFSSGTLTVVGDAESTLKGNILYVSVKANQTIELKSGATGEITINVSTLDILEPVYAIDYESDGITPIDKSEGLSEETAFVISSQPIIKAFRIDSEICEEGIYVCYKFKGSGKIVVDLGDSQTVQAIYDGKVYTGNQLVLTIEPNTPCYVLLTAKDADGNILDGIYLLQSYSQS